MSLKRGSGESSVRNIPCAFAYASTRSICSCARPVSRRYSSVSASIGKIATVEPYSGDMLPMTVRSATGSDDKPAP